MVLKRVDSKKFRIISEKVQSTLGVQIMMEGSPFEAPYITESTAHNEEGNESIVIIEKGVDKISLVENFPITAKSLKLLDGTFWYIHELSLSENDTLNIELLRLQMEDMLFFLDKTS